MMAVFMYKFAKKQLPNICKKMFTVINQTHDHDTRQADDYCVPGWRLETKKRAVAVQGPMIWAEIPPNIKMSDSLNSFRFAMKNYLINKL